MAENAASALPPARPAESGSLRPRIISALVMIPVALAAVWLGSPWMSLLVTAAAGGMAWEWGRLTGRSANWRDGVVLVGVALAVLAIGAFLSFWLGLLALVGGVALIRYQAGGRDPAPLWTAGGLVWILLGSLGIVWLRDDAAHGFAITVWLFAVVWAIDIAAYAAGKTIGGPKLAPSISPKKTWAGLGGGVLAALVVGFVTGLVVGPEALWRITLISGGLAIIEQIGDIAESYAKRRFGAKDSSSLIPGHGGILDRLDGMLAVVIAVVLLKIVTGGNIWTWG